MYCNKYGSGAVLTNWINALYHTLGAGIWLDIKSRSYKQLSRSIQGIEYCDSFP